MGYRIDDFKLDLRKSVTPSNQIWVNSGYSTCSPTPDTVMGVKGCFSPPFAASDTSLAIAIEADNHLIQDTGNKGKEDCGLLFSGAEWRPDCIIRKGTYHFVVDKKLLSLYVVSELIPLTGKAGFMVKATIKNRGTNDISISVKPVINVGHPMYQPLERWDFMPPAVNCEEAKEVWQNIWENNKIRATLLEDQKKMDFIPPGETYTCSFAVVFTNAGVAIDNTYSLDEWHKETIDTWENRIQWANKKIPKLKSNIPGLEEYYKRSLISGLVCLWENDSYIINPFPATSGMDGGSLCCYPWDVAGYSAPSLVMLMEEKMLDYIKLLIASGIDKHICMSLDGKGQGWCSYSYSMWSIINLYWTVVTQVCKGFELFDEIVKLFQAEEARLEEWENLKDYGRQHNLLEMRSCGYEYFVPSPNAERAWCYDRLSDIAEHIGRKGFEVWHEKAAAIRKSIQENLWDEEIGWFKCIHPDGHIETVYSIQDYDALRMGACNEAMKTALLKHLKDGAFLGKYGVTSISAEDEIHYELNDPDWSGGGCYTGDAPNLAQTLWESNEPQLAWDVLKRLFWMGEMLPYYPQEHYCDRPVVPANKRANIIAGIAGIQAIISGMAGVKPELGGKLVINPMPPEEGIVEIKEFNYKDSVIDILMEPNFIRVSINNKVVYEGKPTKIIL